MCHPKVDYNSLTYLPTYLVRSQRKKKRGVTCTGTESGWDNRTTREFVGHVRYGSGNEEGSHTGVEDRSSNSGWTGRSGSSGRDGSR